MSKSETITKKVEGLDNSAFFKERLAYHLHGAHQCVSMMKEEDLEQSDQNQELLCLFNDLQGKMKKNWRQELNQQEEEAPEVETRGGSASQFIGETKEVDLQEDLRLAQKSNRGLRKSNQRLKRANKTLTMNLRQLKLALARVLTPKKVKSNKKLDQNKSVGRSNSSPENVLSNQTSTNKTENPVSRDDADVKIAKENKSEERPSQAPRKVNNKSIQAKPKEKNGESIFLVKHKTRPVDLRRDIKSKIDVLYQAHMRSAEKRLEEMKINIANVMDLKAVDVTGGDYTLVAVKNHTSFLIGTLGKSIKLIERCTTQYSSKTKERLRGVVYVEHLDCYFLSFGSKLYRKNIDTKPPFVYMNIYCGQRLGACFQYSKLNNRLIVNKDKKIITAIDLQAKKQEISIRKARDGDIFVFRLFGENEDRVIAVTTNAYIYLYKLDFAKKKGAITSELTFPLLAQRDERIKSISVCSKNQYVFFEVGQSKMPSMCSRTFVTKLNGDNLNIVSKLDQLSQKVGDKLALECYGYIGSHIIWIGLTKDEESKCKVYNFDTETRAFYEMMSKKRSCIDSFPIKLQRVGEYLYYVGHTGMIKRLYFGI